MLVSFSAFLSPRTLLNLLCMYHKPSKVHVIMQHDCLTFLLQILRYTSHKPAYLIPAIGHQGRIIFGMSNKLQGVFLECHTCLTQVDELLNLSLSLLSGKEPIQECNLENVLSDGDLTWCSAIYPHLVPYLSHIL